MWKPKKVYLSMVAVFMLLVFFSTLLMGFTVAYSCLITAIAAVYYGTVYWVFSKIGVFKE